MIKYKIFNLSVETDCANCTAYGIEALSVSGEVLAKVGDISTDKAAAERLAKTCQRLGLAPYQLLDVATDFVATEGCYSPPKTFYCICTSTVEIDEVHYTAYGVKALDKN